LAANGYVNSKKGRIYLGQNHPKEQRRSVGGLKERGIYNWGKIFFLPMIE